MLALGQMKFAADVRIKVSWESPSTWHLHIKNVTLRDASGYACQVAIIPDRIRIFGKAYLDVVDPKDFEIPSVEIARDEIAVLHGETVTIDCNIHSKGRSTNSWTFTNGSEITDGTWNLVCKEFTTCFSCDSRTKIPC